MRKMEEKTMNEYIICPECGHETYAHDDSCLCCGYMIKGEITIPRECYIHIMDWEFTDIGGKKHNVVGIRVANRIFHYGEEGLKKWR